MASKGKPQAKQAKSTSGEETIVDVSSHATLPTMNTSGNENESLELTGVSFIGGEGPHMIHLRQAMHKTVKKCVGAARYTRFVKSYKFAHQRKPQALKSIAKQFAENLQCEIEKELELMISEENLVTLFNELDQLIKDSSKLDRPAWRPSGNPEKDVKSHIMQPKLKEKERLQLVLKQVEDENTLLHEALIPRKQHLFKTQQEITDKLKMFHQATQACDKISGSQIEQLLSDLSNSTVG